MGFGGSDDIAGRLEGVINEAAKAFAQSRADGREVASEIDNMTDSAERFNESLDGSVERMGALKEETRIIGRSEYFSEMLSSIKEVKSSLGDISGLLKSDFKNALNGIAGAARFTIETLNTMDKTLTNIEGKQSNNVFDLSGMFKQTNKEEIAAYKADVISYVKTVLDAYDELMRLNSTGKGGYNQSVLKIAGINTAEYAKYFAEFRPAVEKIESSLNLTNSFQGLDRKVKEVHDYAAALEGLFRIANEKGVASFDLSKILTVPARGASTAERVTETMTSLSDLKSQVEELNRSKTDQAPVETTMASEGEILSKLNEMYELHKSAVEAAAKAEQEKLEASEKLAEALSRERTVVQTVSESSEKHVEALAREEEQAKSAEEAEQARTESLVVAANTQMEAAKQASLAAQQEEDAGNRSIALIKQESEAQEEYNDIILDTAEKKKIGAGAALQYSEVIEGQFRDIEDMAEMQGRSNQILLEGAQAEEKAAESTRKANAAAEESNEVRQRGIEINQDFENSLNGQSEELDEMEASARQYDNALTQVNNTLKNVQKAMHTLEREKGGTGRAEYAELQALERELQALKDAGHDQDYEGLIDAIARLKNGMSGALQTMNLFTTAEKDAAAAAKENESAARSIEKLIEKYSLLQNKSDEVTQKMLALEQAQRALNNAQPGTEARKTAMEAYRVALDDATRAVKAQADAEKAAAKAKKDSEDADRKKQNLLKQLNTLYGQCVDAEKKYASASKLAHNKDNYKGILDTKEYIRGLIQMLDATDADLDKVGEGARKAGADFAKFNAGIKEGTKGLSGWVSEGFDQLKSRLTYSFGLAAMAYKAASEVKKMVSVAIELNTAMNQLQIVTRSSSEDMDAYANRVSAMAKETGQATKDLIDATTVYARLGYTMNESASLAKYTAMLQGVGNIGASEAQDAMTAIIKAFGKNVDDVEEVMNKMVVVGNNFPISVSQIAEGMNNAGSMLAVANNSLDQSIALLTAANTTVQDISKASTGLRTIAARIRKTTTEEDGGEAINEAKYEEMLGILTKHQVTLTEINGEYRSTYDVIKDIAGVWEQLTSMEQAAVTEALAGTRQQNVFSSLVTQFREAEGAMERMGESAGELQEAYDIYLDSIEAHTKTLKAAYDELAMDFVNSGLVKSVVDFLTWIVEGIDKVIEKVGALGLVLGTIATAGIIKLITSGQLTVLINTISMMGSLGMLPALSTIIPILLGVAGAATAAGIAIHQWKKAHPTLDQLKNDAKETKDELDHLSDTIKTNSDRIQELYEIKEENGGLTEKEQDELELLRKQNEQLEQQKQLLQQIMEYKNAKVVSKAGSDTLGFFNNSERETLIGIGAAEGNVYQKNTSGYGGLLNALSDYAAAEEKIKSIQEQIKKARLDGTEESARTAEKLMDQLSEAQGEAAQYAENIAEFQQWLIERREDLAGATDEQSIEALHQIDDALRMIGKTTGKDKKYLEDFKKDLDKLSGDTLKKLLNGLELTSDEVRELMKWMDEMGYSVEDAAKFFNEYCNEIRDASKAQEELDPGKSIGDLTSLQDELSETTEALEAYKKAMEGGEKGDAVKEMADIYKGALEDLKSGRVDSRRVHNAAELFFSQEQLAEMDYDMAEIGRRMQNSMLEALFDPSGESDQSYGQRFAKYIENDAARFAKAGAAVEKTADGYRFHYDSLQKLADAFGISREACSAFLDDLDAYGIEVMRSTEENIELSNKFMDIWRSAGNARDAVVEFIKQLNAAGRDSMEIREILGDLSRNGVIQLSDDEVKKILQETMEGLDEVDNSNVSPEIIVNADGAINTFRTIEAWINYLNKQRIQIQVDATGTTKVGTATSVPTASKDVNTARRSRAEGGVTGKAGPTLVNELGPELISDRGKAFIANNGEPGFVTLSKDAIVFNADETKQIAKDGGLVSGRSAYADGTRKGLIGRLLSGNDVPARANTWVCKICGSRNDPSATKCWKCKNAKGASNTSAAIATQKAQQQASTTTTQSRPTTANTTTTTTTSSSRWNCNICHFSNPQTAVKCQSCGAVRGAIPQNVPETKTPEQTFQLANGTYWTCSNCGRTNSTSVNYCASCGKYRFSTNVTTIPGNPSTGWKAQQSLNYDDLFSFGGDGGSGGGGGVGGADSQSKSNPQKIDWIAVKLNRIQREISDLETVASSGLKKLSTRLDAAKKEASKLNEEIGIAQSGYNRYIQEANSVGLRSDLAEKARNGTIDIDEYDDEELRQQIQEYQEWYTYMPSVVATRRIIIGQNR